MLKPESPAEPTAADLTIELSVHEGMTKTTLRIRERGLLKFHNKSLDQSLRIESADKPPPFMLEGCTEPQSGFDVSPKGHRTVTVSSAYVVEKKFTYTARIGDSIPEDPIVIIDRR